MGVNREGEEKDLKDLFNLLMEAIWKAYKNVINAICSEVGVRRLPQSCQTCNKLLHKVDNYHGHTFLKIGRLIYLREFAVILPS